MSVTVGQKVSDFTATSTDGEIRLERLAGRKVVLFFYPKDNTPGCTNENADFRDRFSDFEAAGTTVLGVSRDTLKSHDNFRARHAFPFPLISDTDEALCSQFGVIKLKNMYGKKVRGIERSTFLIDTDGTLLREWRGVKVPGHVDEVLEFARSS